MKVSIITIVYNNHRYILDCINSLLRQNYNNIEHIVIDGGSTDGTQELIEPLKHKLAYYISEKDNGLYNALNKGIKEASGDIVGILHSDDLFYEDNSLALIVDAFKRSQADVVFGNGIFVNRDNTKKLRRVYSAKPFKKWYLSWGWIPLHTAIYVKRDVFNIIGYYNENYSIASDYEFSLRLFKSNLKTEFLDHYLVKMRLGGKSTTANLQKRKSMEDLHIIRTQNLLGLFTLFCKIGRKIPQYLKTYFINSIEVN